MKLYSRVTMFSRKAMIAACAAIALVSAPLAHRAAAQTGMDQQPAVVISITPLKEQLADIGYLFKESGFGQFAGMINLQAKEFLKGVDFERPIGAMLFFEEGRTDPAFVAFVPVTNLDDFLNKIAEFADVSEEGDITKILTNDGTEFSVKESNGFAFIANQAERLSELPSAPLSLLGDLPEKYNIAARVYGQNIPAELRGQAMEMIREGMEQNLEQMPEELAEIQRSNIEYQMAQMESFINETAELDIGFAIKADAHALNFDARMVGEKGSNLAQKMMASKDTKPKFTGFLLEGSAFNAVLGNAITGDDAQYAKNMMAEVEKTLSEKIGEEGNLTAEEADTIKGFVSSFFASVSKTIDSGEMHAGLVGKMDGPKMNVALAVQLNDADSLQDSLERFAELAKSKAGDKLSVKMNAAKNSLGTFHQIDVTIPETEEPARKIFGDSLSLNIGLSADNAYLTLGGDGIKLLEEAMQNKGSAGGSGAALSQFNAFLGPIMRFVAEVTPDNKELVQKMAETITKNGNDRITISSEVIDDGMRMRFEIQDGFLKLIPIASQEMGGAFGGNDF